MTLFLPVGFVPVDAHVAGGVVDEVVDVIAQLAGGGSTSCLETREKIIANLIV